MPAVVVVFQPQHSKVAIPVFLMPGVTKHIVVCFFVTYHRLVFQVEMFLQILADDFRLAICTGIVNNCADKWKCGLLHREAIHGILDIGCLVESDTPCADHPFKSLPVPPKGRLVRRISPFRGGRGAFIYSQHSFHLYVFRVSCQLA